MPRFTSPPRLVLAFCLVGWIVPAAATTEVYFPPPESAGGWRQAAPASLGVDPAALDRDLIVVRQGNMNVPDRPAVRQALIRKLVAALPSPARP